MIETSHASARLTVLVAEDHPVMREGIATLLEKQGGFTVTGRAASARETRARIERLPPQVLLMDLMLQEDDGLALIKDLAVLAPTVRIVVFSLHPEDIYAERCLRAGAHGYVMKREPVETLFRALRDVAAGGIAVSPGIAATLLGGLTGRVRPTGGPGGRLTDRELQVFRQVGLARSTREIAETLGVSIKTIEAHRENIKNKLGLDSAAALLNRAALWVRETETA